MQAGKLNRRITIEQKVTKKLTNGTSITVWEALHENIAANIEPLSVKDFIAANAGQIEITARITIRYTPNLNVNMRIIHWSQISKQKNIYSITGFLEDKKSGMQYLTILANKNSTQEEL